MDRIRLLALFAALGLFIIATLLMLGPVPLSIAGVPVQLRLDVTPNAIPVSGVWVVRPCLLYQSNDSCISVDTSVKMTALLGDRSSFIQTLPTTNGAAAFSVPASTVLGVSFSATYGNYSGLVRVYGPVVIPVGEGSGYVFYALSAGTAFVALPASGKTRKLGRFRPSQRILRLAGCVFALLPPIAYLYTTASWSGTGWLPILLGIFPVALPLLSVIPFGLALLDPERRKHLREFVESLRERGDD